MRTLNGLPVFNDILQMYNYLRNMVFMAGAFSHSKKWQGENNKFAMLEVLHASGYAQMEEDPSLLDSWVNQWARDHFKERVSGIPYNPPPSHTAWLKDTENFFSKKVPGKFSHTYPERFWSTGLWPKAGGIRYQIGNLGTLVDLFKKEPDTRQGYLPMFFPEDLTAAMEDERVPCSLGWHFIVRDGRMNCFYPIRSCDVTRHLKNDLYFANRLVIWLLVTTGLDKQGIKPGIIHFACTSLHAFEADKYGWEKEQRCKES